MSIRTTDCKQIPISQQSRRDEIFLAINLGSTKFGQR
jgi:hypothetical protein